MAGKNAREAVARRVAKEERARQKEVDCLVTLDVRDRLIINRWK